MNKLAIANWGSAQQGKSESIKLVFKLLSEKYPYTILIDNGDIKAIVEIAGVKVGIESQGDPNSRMPQSIDDFVSQGCGIIVCACRTKGDTGKKIYDLKEKGYEVIWTQNDRTIFKNLYPSLNKLYAEHIVKTIEARILGAI